MLNSIKNCEDLSTTRASWAPTPRGSLGLHGTPRPARFAFDHFGFYPTAPQGLGVGPCV